MCKKERVWTDIRNCRTWTPGRHLPSAKHANRRQFAGKKAKQWGFQIEPQGGQVEPQGGQVNLQGGGDGEEQCPWREIRPISRNLQRWKINGCNDEQRLRKFFSSPSFFGKPMPFGASKATWDKMARKKSHKQWCKNLTVGSITEQMGGQKSQMAW